MELLAPAGSEEAVFAAVGNGADAIYIGGSKFSARHSAKNFDEEEIKRVLDYCRIRGVKVHVAANILVKDKEYNEFMEYIGFLNDLGVDAVIMQDVGMAANVRKFFPDLPIHASTQMTAASLDSVKFLEKNGFSRVVLSRELSEKEIEYICKNTKTEIEIFVHGALCMCYSGQCLFSSIIGGRSGNRGMCAQPCRLPYELTDGKKTINNGYLLSPKDLSLADELSALEKAGVTSLKIEGRLKKPEYVAAVTGVYSKLLKSMNKPSDKDWEILYDAFNRSGFTKGYFKNKLGIDMMSIKKPGNAAENKIKAVTSERKIKINIYATLENDKCATVVFIDEDGNTVTATSRIKVEKAENKPLSRERVVSQFSKLGGTAFKADKIEAEVGDGVIIPISELNDMRRHACEELEKIRSKKPKYRTADNIQQTTRKENRLENKIFSAKVKNIKQAEACIEMGIKRIYAPEEAAKLINCKNTEIITVLPHIWREKNIKNYYVKDGVLLSNIGEAEHFKSVPLFGDSGLNIFNSESVGFFDNFKSLTVSSELNLKEIMNLKAYTPLEIVVYGRLPLMTAENCPAKANNACGKKLFLKDRKNERFPLSCGVGCYCEILNSKALYMADKMKELEKTPADIYRFDFTIETPDECKRIISDYLSGNAAKNDFTRGHYYRGAE